jgi:hypothetical protein
MPHHPIVVHAELPPVLLAVDGQDAAGADDQVDAPMAVKRAVAGWGALSSACAAG